MAARPLIRTGTPRAGLAAALLIALVALLLGAWFVTGWHDVQARQRQLAAAPLADAAGRTAELARVLHADLEGLMARETRRPYFHYQNLMRDPRASAGLNVTPSPLASGSDDERVVGYFQIDTTGRVTTPTINDELPGLSDRTRLAEHRAFLERVGLDVLPQLRAPAAGAAPAPDAPNPSARGSTRPATQMLQMDRSVYGQNLNPVAVYTQQLSLARPPEERAPAEVTITISPLEWRTLPYGGAPTLVAVRQVQTPDGVLTQGFVLDRPALERWASARSGGLNVALHAADGHGVPVAPGWAVALSPDPRAVAQATADSRAVARAFLLQFAGVGMAALVAGAGVLLLVLRAERLARERSQFAAAAAHELRTPLAGLQLYGDMLADGLGDVSHVRDYARRMSEDAARLGRVVSNVLGVSQLERGSLHVDVQDGPLGQVLCELVAQAEPALARAGASVAAEVAPDLRARFDRDALVRIVGNLIDNAEKYSRGAEDRTIGFSAIERGDSIEVQVGDRGPGVPDAAMARLFRPFSRGLDAADGPAGLGLGLALSKSLAQAMGGDLTYRHRPGGGSTFVLRLSRAWATEVVAPAATSRPPV
jgi:signal transduction histidine kinase